MSKKIDARVIRTKRTIKTSFLTLIAKNGYEQVTVQDISEAAQINRATFYLHYYDKPFLLESLIHEITEELSQTIKPTLYIEEGIVYLSKLEHSLQNIFEHINQELLFYEITLGESGLNDSSNVIQLAIRKSFETELLALNLQQRSLSVPFELLVEFMSSALLGMIRWWVNSEQIYSTKHLSKKLAEIITKGPLSAGGLKIVE